MQTLEEDRWCCRCLLMGIWGTCENSVGRISHGQSLHFWEKNVQNVGYWNAVSKHHSLFGSDLATWIVSLLCIFMGHTVEVAVISTLIFICLGFQMDTCILASFMKNNEMVKCFHSHMVTVDIVKPCCDVTSQQVDCLMAETGNLVLKSFKCQLY